MVTKLTNVVWQKERKNEQDNDLPSPVLCKKQ